MARILLPDTGGCLGGRWQFANDNHIVEDEGAATATSVQELMVTDSARRWEIGDEDVNMDGE